MKIWWSFWRFFRILEDSLGFSRTVGIIKDFHQVLGDILGFFSRFFKIFEDSLRFSANFKDFHDILEDF